MMKRALMLAALVTMVGTGCSPDSDGDGLSNKEEKDLGLDPENPDVDGDGLMDGEDPFPSSADMDEDRLDDLGERDAGSNPEVADTDGDGYLDGDEVAEGKDPTDDKSRIYKGNWPYYWNKDEDLGDTSFPGVPVIEGDTFPRHVAVDQKGDTVDLYDFGGPDQTYKYIVIDASAEWCGPCRNGASWLAGDDDPYGLEADFADVREAVDNGELLWVTVITQDNDYGPGDEDTVRRWDEDFKNKRIPVLADEQSDVELAVIGTQENPGTGGWPSGMIVRASNMKVEFVGLMVTDLLVDAQSRL